MTPKSLHCRYCGKLYRKTKFLSKHEEFHVNSGDAMTVEFVKLFRLETAQHEQGKKENIELMKSLGSNKKKKKKRESTKDNDPEKEQFVYTEENDGEISPCSPLFDDLEVQVEETAGQGFKIQTVPMLDEDENSQEWKGTSSESKEEEETPIEDPTDLVSQSESPYIVPGSISYAETTSDKNGEHIFDSVQSNENIQNPNRDFTHNTDKPGRIQVYGSPQAQMPVFIPPYFSLCMNMYGPAQLMDFQQQIMSCSEQIANLQQQHAAELGRERVLNLRRGDV